MYSTVLFVALLPFVSFFLTGMYLGTTYLCFCNILFGFLVLYLVFYFDYSVFPNFVQVCRRVPLGGNPIKVNKHHILSYHKPASELNFIALYFCTVTTFNHCLFPFVSRTQQISDAEGHAIQTEGEAYNSVRV
jgi:hypothetical protein